jgi:[pyruvate, water dikinase]-phosphate phosphotransferase / [pyruvate, water dikinase] kinase
MMEKNTVFFVSDRTGITAEMLGQSLLTQFDSIRFEHQSLPFVDSIEKARAAVEVINLTAQKEGQRPVVFSTLVADATRQILQGANALILDFFEAFISPLESELGVKSTHSVGRSHGMARVQDYDKRIEAVNYALGHDDGITQRGLEDADVILVGVSRSGKTPTSLYLALQCGIRAANYPLIPEDLEAMRLPGGLEQYRHKVWGLTIRPDRLHQVRTERRPDSDYAQLANCRREISRAETLMQNHGIPFFDSTNRSIEELATVILQAAKLERHLF